MGPAKPTGARIFSSGISDSAKGNWHLDQSLQSKIIALAFSMAAEIERDLISQRTKEALRFKKAQGLKLGRPRGPGKSKLDAFRPEIESLVIHFWRSMRGQDPLPAFSALGPDPTVAELGRHLDLMAGWTIRSAA